MLKSSELRIGNWVHIGGRDTQVYELCYDFLTTTLDKGNYEYIYEVVEPILLTEEWLLRFGFVRIERRSETIYANGGFHLVPQGKGFIFKVVDQIVNYTTIRYVHTLQNLHFSLCGVELQPVTTPQHS